MALGVQKHTEESERTAPPRHQRFLTDQHTRYLGYIDAAKTYLKQIGGAKDDWLFLKPYRADDHREFFTLTYNVLNLLEVMAVPPKGRILEVGSGAGWLTEILMGLGYEVYALEPSEDMIAVARERAAGFIRHHHYKNPPPVHYLCHGLEECSLADESVHGIIFHEALHHVVDEERGLAQCFRVLKPGGVLGVTGEGAWVPGDRRLESACEDEMRRYGTLENPYTFEYLKYLLDNIGFEETTRYHGINGFFPEAAGDTPIKQADQAPAHDRNHFTSRKPLAGPTTANQRGATKARLQVLSVKREAGFGQIRIAVQLTNDGETTWLYRPRSSGWVMLALYRGEPGGDGFSEAPYRNRLPRSIAPGESVELDAAYFTPPDGWGGDWRLDLVNEGCFWFNLRVAVSIPA